MIAERCSQAIHILDRFHIVAKMNAALNHVRADEARRLARGRMREPILKKSRWCVLKRKRNLTEHQRFRLRDLLRYNLRTGTSLFAEGGFPATLGVLIDRPGLASSSMSGAVRSCALASNR